MLRTLRIWWLVRSAFLMGVVESWEAHLHRQSARETLAEHSMESLQKLLGTKPETAHCCYVWPCFYNGQVWAWRAWVTNSLER